MVKLTEEEFSQHINTKFRLNLDTPPPIELNLVEVKGYEKKSEPGEQGGMERFSLFFTGPGDIYLPQKAYALEHDQMGALDIFLVPIGRDDRGYCYEAVFNYYK